MATEVEIWWVPLDRARKEHLRLEAVLSVEERARADRFRTEELRNRYCVAHGALRHLLARKLNRSPADLSFERGSAGKPLISSRQSSAPPHFNLSHSEDMALIAISADRPVGIDIERYRKGIDVKMLAKQYFAPGEARQILSLPDAEQVQAFLVWWTRKEAYLKATGSGLSTPLDSFEISALPDAAPRLLSAAGDSQAANRWRFVDLGDETYAAALAVETLDIKVTKHDFLAFAN